MHEKTQGGRKTATEDHARFHPRNMILQRARTQTIGQLLHKNEKSVSLYKEILYQRPTPPLFVKYPSYTILDGRMTNKSITNYLSIYNNMPCCGWVLHILQEFRLQKDLKKEKKTTTVNQEISSAPVLPFRRFDVTAIVVQNQISVPFISRARVRLQISAWLKVPARTKLLLITDEQLNHVSILPQLIRMPVKREY